VVRTIGRRLPRRHIGDPTCECAYCGLVDYRSKMRLDAEGKYACRLEGKGRTSRELDEAVAAGSPAKRHNTSGETGNARWEDEI
jgi:hypothetical protein